ncbi:Cytochrome c heme lyase [Zancudomyces culisetae]|uniref:Holocytochrome c-type synthase n=1 Tax=Zancudomyces culisetae TaxID=1213189 RepID=A0A1R1PNC7_ZANCU|nr:Cytochrome c heme lyase [Zancudomyces culisetae]|eukprot:OMH82454.1 Cytochrome c heme lyase [Zancudomyces culisetae]
MSDKGESKCPVDHTKQQIQVNTTSENTTAKCPSANHSKFYGGKINPLNNMPEDLSQSLPGAQQANLPKEREISSIPRSDGQNGENWEYPSPQQFFNALSRKGMPVGEEHVETMVHIHNFLNEGAWDEVLRWEKRIDKYVVFLIFFLSDYIHIYFAQEQ